MFTLLAKRDYRGSLAIEFPSLAVAFLIAELFFKFHSFSLECLAFLATWMLLGGMLHLVRGLRSR